MSDVPQSYLTAAKQCGLGIDKADPKEVRCYHGGLEGAIYAHVTMSSRIDKTTICLGLSFQEFRGEKPETMIEDLQSLVRYRDAIGSAGFPLSSYVSDGSGVEYHSAEHGLTIENARKMMAAVAVLKKQP